MAKLPKSEPPPPNEEEEKKEKKKKNPVRCGSYSGAVNGWLAGWLYTVPVPDKMQQHSFCQVLGL